MTRSFAPRKLPRAVILNNEIMPYRVPLFEALHNRSDLETLVIFSTARSWDRTWTIDPASLTFPHRILPGVCLHPPKSQFSEKRSIYINPTLFLELVRLRPDVIIGYEFSVPTLTALVYARIAHRPLLIWSECTALTDSHLTADQHWTRRLIIPRAQGFFGTSSSACRNLIALGAPPERVMEAPQVHQVDWIIRQATQAREKRPSPDGLILYVGSLIERKGIDRLLEAFSRIAANHPSARLRIVGDGPLRKSLEQKTAQAGLQSRVEFAGFVEPADIPSEYAQAAVFVLPSFEDTFAVVVVEAMAAGVPVICSSFAGVSTYLEDGTNSFVVDPNDTELLSARIASLLDDRTLGARFIRQGTEIAKTFEARSVAEVFAKGILRAVDRGIA
jgi:glycosyltransferase involved in cell wall biosynthesis